MVWAREKWKDGRSFVAAKMQRKGEVTTLTICNYDRLLN
jgi:hypothetical protein